MLCFNAKSALHTSNANIAADPARDGNLPQSQGRAGKHCSCRYASVLVRKARMGNSRKELVGGKLTYGLFSHHTATIVRAAWNTGPPEKACISVCGEAKTVLEYLFAHGERKRTYVQSANL